MEEEKSVLDRHIVAVMVRVRKSYGKNSRCFVSTFLQIDSKKVQHHCSMVRHDLSIDIIK